MAVLRDQGTRKGYFIKRKYDEQTVYMIIANIMEKSPTKWNIHNKLSVNLQGRPNIRITECKVNNGNELYSNQLTNKLN